MFAYSLPPLTFQQMLLLCWWKEWMSPPVRLACISCSCSRVWIFCLVRKRFCLAWTPLMATDLCFRWVWRSAYRYATRLSRKSPWRWNYRFLFSISRTDFLLSQSFGWRSSRFRRNFQQCASGWPTYSLELYSFRFFRLCIHQLSRACSSKKRLKVKFH